jgi:hypothetical protein
MGPSCGRARSCKGEEQAGQRIALRSSPHRIGPRLAPGSRPGGLDAFGQPCVMAALVRELPLEHGAHVDRDARL